ncbi:MAG: PAS domain S-box protein [Chrysiogenales bacterium]|nr:MAG: PAS domain S-box protein [Chrysiogenales bacterium]
MEFMAIIEEALERAATGVIVCGMDGSILYASGYVRRLLERGSGSPSKSPRHVRDISTSLEGVVDALGKGEPICDIEIGVKGDSVPDQRVFCSAFLVHGKKDEDDTAALVIRGVISMPLPNPDEKWREIIDSLDEGYYEVDRNGVLTFINLEMCKIVGYERSELLGKKYHVLFNPEEAARIKQSFREVFRRGISQRLTNWNFTDRNGRIKKLESSISLIRDSERTIMGFRGIVRDFTDKKKVEKELLRARKLEAIGILAGGIAHDFNNALTAILGNISLAKMEASADDGGLMEVLNDAEQASLKAVDLTRRLATFAQGGKPERKIIDYTGSLRMTVDSVLNGYTGRHELIISDRLWTVDIDEFQVGQVITYMLNNAIESMEQKDTIRVIAENVVVEEEKTRDEISLQPGRYLRISIQDEGKGISPDEMHNIFDPYYSTKEMASGMGLATSYAIIKRHYGYIDVESSPGRGTTFFVYLPAVTDESVPQEDMPTGWA